MLTEKSEKVVKSLYCEKCDYTTSRKSQYERHLITAKHINVTKCNKKSLKNGLIYRLFWVSNNYINNS